MSEGPATRRASRARSEADNYTGPLPVIANIVCGVDLNCRVDLQLLARSLRNTEYKPKRFPAVMIKIREPKATALVFAGGKMQVLGCKTVQDAHLAARKFARQIQKQGYKPKMTDFTVQNMVGHADTKIVIRLEGIALKHSMFASYEPEIFPGLIYRVQDPKCTLLVFSNGKVVITGCKTLDDVDTAMKKVWRSLLEFRTG